MLYEDDDFFNQILRSHEEGDGKKGKEYMKAMVWIRIRYCWPYQDPEKNHFGSGKLRI
jgi:hypothetical protein